jgi:hypothetical protein
MQCAPSIDRIGVEQRADGLVNIASLGVPPKLDATHRAFLARIVEEGPSPASHGVVWWRACDLILRLYEEFGLSAALRHYRSESYG